LAQRDKLKKDFEILLKGRDYEQWHFFSKKLTNLNKVLTNHKKKTIQLEAQINELNFEL
jgi:hypothetical protein